MLRAGAVVADDFETRAGKGLFYLRFDCFKRNHNRYNVTTLQRYIVTSLHRYIVKTLQGKVGEGIVVVLERPG